MRTPASIKRRERLLDDAIRKTGLPVAEPVPVSRGGGLQVFVVGAGEYVPRDGTPGRRGGNACLGWGMVGMELEVIRGVRESGNHPEQKRQYKSRGRGTMTAKTMPRSPRQINPRRVLAGALLMSPRFLGRCRQEFRGLVIAALRPVKFLPTTGYHIADLAAPIRPQSWRGSPKRHW